MGIKFLFCHPPLTDPPLSLSPNRQYRWYKSSYLFGKGAQWDLLVRFSQTSQVLSYGSDSSFVQVIQCSAVLLGEDDFIATVAQRFGVIDYFGLGEPKPSDIDETSESTPTEAQQLALAEEFFKFLLQVITNRALISPELGLRKQIIQWLAAGDKMTHSKLIKQITYEKISNKGKRGCYDDENLISGLNLGADVEQILAEVAVFVRPYAGKQGYFQLKPAYGSGPAISPNLHLNVLVRYRFWSEFNPYFLHFTKADLNLATENYHNVSKGNYEYFSDLLQFADSISIGYPAKALLPIATPSTPYQMFDAIDNLLQSSLLHSLIFAVLRNVVGKSKRSSGNWPYPQLCFCKEFNLPICLQSQCWILLYTYLLYAFVSNEIKNQALQS